jgi:hypothetical protein
MDYVPAADGQRFLMKVPVKESPPAITVVLNWPAMLKSATRKIARRLKRARRR